MAECDTIVALASGAPPCGVAVIRVSGPEAGAVWHWFKADRPLPRQAGLRRLLSDDGQLLDEALTLWFPAPASFTGEDVAELHCHGGPATVEAMLDALCARKGVRVAGAGEFSRRAFENGRMDLTQLEGLADLVQAETEWQRRQAIAHSDGGLRAQAEAWRSAIIRARAAIEASFDFADEEDVPDDVSAAQWEAVVQMAAQMHDALQSANRGEIARTGFTVAIAGPPNAGKSSLLNALAKREAAIVTDLPGTTRDVLEVRLDLDGMLVRLLDTAGLRETQDPVERIGIERAEAAMRNADLTLWLNPFDAPVPPPVGVDALVVHSKGDLADNESDGLTISTKRRGGTDDLIAAIKARASRGSDGAAVLLSRRRHRDCVGDALAELRLALRPDVELELRAEHLRRAGDALGRLVGRIDVEELLDVIFAEFCVGK